MELLGTAGVAYVDDCAGLYSTTVAAAADAARLDGGGSILAISGTCVMALARRKDPPEIAVGYRAAGEDHAVLNPPDKHEPRQWHPDDRLVVLAED